jgi:hypothetical protein
MSNIANKVLNTTDVPFWYALYWLYWYKSTNTDAAAASRPGDRYDVWWLLDLGKGEVWEVKCVCGCMGAWVDTFKGQGCAYLWRVCVHTDSRWRL